MIRWGIGAQLGVIDGTTPITIQRYWLKAKVFFMTEVENDEWIRADKEDEARLHRTILSMK